MECCASDKPTASTRWYWLSIANWNSYEIKKEKYLFSTRGYQVARLSRVQKGYKAFSIDFFFFLCSLYISQSRRANYNEWNVTPDFILFFFQLKPKNASLILIVLASKIQVVSVIHWMDDCVAFVEITKLPSMVYANQSWKVSLLWPISSFSQFFSM